VYNITLQYITYNKLGGRPPQYASTPPSWPLTFWPWKWGSSRVWRGLPLCHFLPRDAMRKRGLAVARCPSVRPSVRLSVCLSVTLVYCIQTGISSKFFLGPVAPSL